MSPMISGRVTFAEIVVAAAITARRLVNVLFINVVGYFVFLAMAAVLSMSSMHILPLW